jgi:hypothetical protein
MLTLDSYIGSRTVLPSRLGPGDVVADLQGEFALMVDEIEPIMISYKSGPVPVWWVRGHKVNPAGHYATVITVCIPRQHWYLLKQSQPVAAAPLEERSEPRGEAVSAAGASSPSRR